MAEEVGKARTSRLTRDLMKLVSGVLLLPSITASARPKTQFALPGIPHSLTVESQDAPLGIDEARPRFAWQAPDDEQSLQASYQIQVARSETELKKGSPLVWDTKRVSSSQETQVVYAGAPLKTRARYFWRVRTWQPGGPASPWSAPASWEMGLLVPSDWHARWIGGRQQLDHDWRDADITWRFRLVGDSVGLLFHAQPVGKSYGEAYLWKITKSSEHGLTLQECTRHYPGGASPRVIETVLKRVTLPPGTNPEIAIKVSISGKTITTSFNGDVIDVLEDNSVASGTVGVIGAIDPKHPLAAILRSLTVAARERATFAEDFEGNHNDLSGGSVEGNGLSVPNGTSPLSPPRDIVVPLGTPAPLLRRAFDIQAVPSRARLYVAAGGFAKVWVNGIAIADSGMENDFTAYNKRVLYRTYDVTAQLHSGNNVVSVELGRGRYGITTPTEWYWNQAPWHANPAVRAQLEIEEGGSTQEIATDAQWRTIDGPTRADSIYSGENYDARLNPAGWKEPGFDDREWQQATVVNGPAGKLEADKAESIRILDRLQPVSITQPKPGTWVFDFGRIVSGWLQLSVSGSRGATLSLVQTEKLAPDGTVQVPGGLVDAQLQTDHYTMDGRSNEEWQPSFSYKGFRYVQVEGLNAAPGRGLLTALVARTASPQRGTFSSSDDLLNKIQQAAVNSLANNMHGLQSDTPTYEKNGWTGDAQASSLAAILNFNETGLWSKWLEDFVDAQSEKGEIPEIVPSTPYYGYEKSPGWKAMWGPTPAWDAATFILPSELYRQTGDRRILERMYRAQLALVNYTSTFINRGDRFTYDRNLGEYAAAASPGLSMPTLPKHEDGSLPSRDETVDFLVEHMPVGLTGPVDATSVAYFYMMVHELAKNELLLGKLDSAATHLKLAAEIRKAYNTRYWDGSQKIYRSLDEHGHERWFSQTQNILPVAFGMEPPGTAPDIVRALNQDIVYRRYHLTCGVYGIRYLMKMLSDFGYTDTAYAVATETTEPSWGWWVNNDLQTMLEGWSLSSRSWDHHYFAEISAWFYQSLAGIVPARPGYSVITILPRIPAKLSSARAEVKTLRGSVVSAWEHMPDGGIHLHVVIPANSVGEVWVPLPKGGRAYSSESSVSIRRTRDAEVFRITSGTHDFVSRPRE